MSEQETEAETAHVSVNGIGGIENAEVDLPPGLSVLSGQNATNRTSLIHAINAALGGTRAYPNVNADEGTVELTLDGETYTRTVRASGGNVSYSGDPVTEDEDLVDTFVTLTDENPIRSTIMSESHDDVNRRLRDLLMGPIDVDEIERERRELQQKQSDIEQEIQSIKAGKERLPSLKDRKRSLEQELEEVREAIEEKEQEIEEAEVDRQESEEADRLLEDLKNARTTEENIEQRLENARDDLESFKQEREQLQERVEELEETIDEMADVGMYRLTSLQERRKHLNKVESLIQNAQQANRQLMEETDSLPEEFHTETDDVIAQLSPESEQVECWACGTTVQPEAFSNQLEELLEIQKDYTRKKREIKNEIDEIRSQVSEKENVEDELTRARRDLSNREETIESKKSEIEDLEDRLETQREAVEDLEQQVEETEELRDHEVVELHEEARSLSNKEGRLENELDEVKEEIQSIENEAEGLDALNDSHDELQDQIDELKGRVDRLERRAEETLQEHLNELVNVLDYDNIDGIRIDRKPGDVNGETQFNINIVRKGETGGKEDVFGLQTLSESERSLVGLVVALAGYQTHDVHKEVPMILLDSIEEFDSERIGRLLDYITDRVPRIVVALLPEDVSEVSTEHDTVMADDVLA